MYETEQTMHNAWRKRGEEAELCLENVINAVTLLLKRDPPIMDSYAINLIEKIIINPLDESGEKETI